MLSCAVVPVAAPDGIQFMGEAQSKDQGKKSECGYYTSQEEHRAQTASSGHCNEHEPKPARLWSVQKAAVFAAEPVEKIRSRDHQNRDGHKRCNVHMRTRLTVCLA